MWFYYYGFYHDRRGDGVFEMTRLVVNDYGLYFGQHLVELADADAKISPAAFRVVAQLLHCTRVVFYSNYSGALPAPE